MIFHLPIERLSKESFASLCTNILKTEISQRVRQVSETGRDGGRDAILNGKCDTGRYEPKRVQWVFQYKQHDTDITRARSAVFTSFSTECPAVFMRYPGTDAYILLTSVPFSGPPKTGLLDRVNEKAAELSATFDAEIDFWDGLELQNLVLRNPTLYAHYFTSLFGDLTPALQRASGKPWAFRQVAEGIPLMVLPPLEALFLPQALGPDFYNWLFPNVSPLFGPDGGSALWRYVEAGENHRLYGLLLSLTNRKEIRECKREWNNPVHRAGQWSKLLLALMEARTGETALALQRVGMLLSTQDSTEPPEFLAWLYNVKSICDGKLNNEDKASTAALQAIMFAEQAGVQWLSTSIRIRILHRQSWHAWEQDTPIPHTDFMERLSDQSGNSPHYRNAERRHVHALEVAAKALHLTWDHNQANTARRLASEALGEFLALNDAEEAARMVSELGRNVLQSGGSVYDAITYLTEASQMRAWTGNLARLRYDLSWLADAYLQVGMQPFASVCLRAALNLHCRLYADVKTDDALISRLADQLEACHPAAEKVITVEEVRSLATATGIEFGIWLSILFPVAPPA